MYTITTNSSWRAISANSVVAFQVVGALPVRIGRGDDEPVVGFSYSPGFGDRGAIADLFPNTPGNVVWAASSGASEIVVS